MNDKTRSHFCARPVLEVLVALFPLLCLEAFALRVFTVLVTAVENARVSYMRVYVYACTCVSMYVCVYMYVCVCECVLFVFVCVNTYV